MCKLMQSFPLVEQFKFVTCWAILCCFRALFCPPFVSYYVNFIQIWKFHFVGHYAGEIFVKSLLPYLLIICEAMKFLALLRAYLIQGFIEKLGDLKKIGCLILKSDQGLQISYKIRKGTFHQEGSSLSRTKIQIQQFNCITIRSFHYYFLTIVAMI